MHVLNGSFVLDVTIDHVTYGVYVVNQGAHQFNLRRLLRRAVEGEYRESAPGQGP